ncbi:MAG TPA: LytTR family DNA-binding domain-containing protein [Gemmatimonadaceae bacterium]|jgi:two-component system LytT family response regulator|nr:LytTR family DNA-binding domain-containing protein [Gemmatimonadaceae bacterium]
MKVMVVDDEPLARRRLKAMLAEQSDIEVVAEYEDPEDALKVLPDSEADVLFLDIQMPELDGFQVLDRLGSRPPPFVIFVTAHAEHAVRAFDTDATDYLLKPYDRERLERSLDRARAALAATEATNGGALGTQVRELVDQLRERTVYLDRVAVTMGRRTYFVSTRAIDWVQADRNYLRLHVGTKCHLIRSTISGIESRLDPTQFARVHRSFIVRIDHVKELRALVSGEYRVVLVDGTELPMSPQYRDRLPRG